MPKIKRYTLKSKASNDETFEVKKVVKTTHIVETITETDENGNIITVTHQPPPISHKPIIEEGISAIALPSGTQAEVIILETDEGLTEAGKEQERIDNSHKPISL